MGILRQRDDNSQQQGDDGLGAEPSSSAGVQIAPLQTRPSKQARSSASHLSAVDSAHDQQHTYSRQQQDDHDYAEDAANVSVSSDDAVARSLVGGTSTAGAHEQHFAHQRHQRQDERFHEGDEYYDDEEEDGVDDELALEQHYQGGHLQHATQQQQQQQQQQRQYYHYHQQQGGDEYEGDELMAGEDLEDEEEEDEEDDGGSFSDSGSSSLSIPEEDIDFGLVYVLATFLATVDGQASVVKGDKLMLLDDSNSYWWLVRVLKSHAVGYIPAEIIETPWERLARLNKHRNLDLTSATTDDHISGAHSTFAQTRFVGRIPPSQQPHPHLSRHPTAVGMPAPPTHKDHPSNMSPAERIMRSESVKAKRVFFTAPTYYEHSASGLTDEEDYEEGEEGYSEGEFEESYSDEGEMVGDEREGDETIHASHQQQQQLAQLQGDQIFEDGSDFSDEDDEAERATIREDNDDGTETVVRAAVMAPHQPQLSPQPLVATAHELHQPQSAAIVESVAEPSTVQQRALSPVETHPHAQPFISDSLDEVQSASEAPHGDAQQGSPSSRLPVMTEDAFDPHGPTKKLTATPAIVRDPTFDFDDPYGQGEVEKGTPPRIHGVELVNVDDPRFAGLLPHRKVGDPSLQPPPPGYVPPPDTDYGVGELRAAAPTQEEQQQQLGRGNAPRTGSNTPPSPMRKLRRSRESLDGQQAAQQVDDKKQRKGSGGIFGGLFSRKKDKKKQRSSSGGGEEDDESLKTRSSEESSHNSPQNQRRQRQTVLSPTPMDGSQRGASLDSTGSNASATSPQTSSSGKRRSQTIDSMFSTDAALRQQQIEAQQVMSRQYGISREPGDATNRLTPRGPGAASPQQDTLSPLGYLSESTTSPLQQQGQPRRRPGSLIGSPAVPGLDVPQLSVLRVFAGDNIDSDASFKTVLLTPNTTTDDLVKQAKQRFRLIGAHERDDYYLTIRELGGDDQVVQSEQKPLALFEALAQTPDDSAFQIPSIKRSSVGSINSISSDLSLNPAITKLGMNDFSDDSAVKFFLHRRVAPQGEATEAGLMPSTPQTPDGALSPSSLSFRFAVRVLISPEDLPDTEVFDPQSSAVIPRHILEERQQRDGASSPAMAESTPRERIIFLPKNVQVSEAVEAALSRFGIADGVLDGGDGVDERVLNRRSITKARYNLAMRLSNEEPEMMLSTSTKLIEHYPSPPQLKAYDRSSKEFRRRSVDATLILGTPADVQPTDPVFVLRKTSVGSNRASLVLGASNVPADEVAMKRQQRQYLEAEKPKPVRENTATSTDTYVTAVEPPQEVPPRPDSKTEAPASPRSDEFTAQRVLARANHQAMVSARKNTEQGVDITLHDSGKVRSARADVAQGVRYSYISPSGTETDISEIVRSEWPSSAHAPSSPTKMGSPSQPRASSRASRLTMGGMTTDTESYRTATSSPGGSDASTHRRSTSSRDSRDEGEDEEAREAIQALEATPLAIDTTPGPASPVMASPAHRGRTEEATPDDVLRDALRSTSVSPVPSDAFQERLDRVLERVRSKRSSLRSELSIQSGLNSRSGTPSGMQSVSSFATLNGRMSPSSSLGGRLSPLSGRLSPISSGDGQEPASIDALITSARSITSPSTVAQHTKQTSITSLNSTRSSTSTTGTQPSTPTGTSNGGHGTSITPMSSAPRADSQASAASRPQIVYRDEHLGLEYLMAVAGPPPSRTARPQRPVVRDEVWGDVLDNNLRFEHDEVTHWHRKALAPLSDLESRLDSLLLQTLRSP